MKIRIYIKWLDYVNTVTDNTKYQMVTLNCTGEIEFRVKKTLKKKLLQLVKTKVNTKFQFPFFFIKLTSSLQKRLIWNCYSQYFKTRTMTLLNFIFCSMNKSLLSSHLNWKPKKNIPCESRFSNLHNFVLDWYDLL